MLIISRDTNDGGIWYDFLEETKARFYCIMKEEDMEVCTINYEAVWLCKMF